MENTTSRRGFLKACGLVALAAAGCATLYHPISEQEREYRRIDPNNLTAKQKHYIAEFDENVAEVYKDRGINKIPQETKDWIKTEYPFINPEKLGPRDKVFLMKGTDKDFEWIWLK